MGVGLVHAVSRLGWIDAEPSCACYVWACSREQLQTLFSRWPLVELASADQRWLHWRVKFDGAWGDAGTVWAQSVSEDRMVGL